MGIKQILLIVGVIFLFRFISRVWKVRKTILEQRDAMMNQARAAQKQQREEGEINVVNRGQKPKKNLDEGSYVDYEEID
jgi:hypothetical protein